MQLLVNFQWITEFLSFLILDLVWFSYLFQILFDWICCLHFWEWPSLCFRAWCSVNCESQLCWWHYLTSNNKLYCTFWRKLPFYQFLSVWIKLLERLHTSKFNKIILPFSLRVMQKKLIFIQSIEASEWRNLVLPHRYIDLFYNDRVIVKNQCKKIITSEVRPSPFFRLLSNAILILGGWVGKEKNKQKKKLEKQSGTWMPGTSA